MSNHEKVLAPLDRLTPLELVIARMLADGKGPAEIGRLRGRSPGTIKAQKKGILAKLAAYEIETAEQLAALINGRS
jgi:DNA-binding CsgD family transcriptional regulator